MPEQHIFDFGISQEDARVEHAALDIQDGDRLLCISSAGEVPLNMLAMSDIHVKSLDVSKNQNFLTSLKLNAVRSLDPGEAAAFLGFSDAGKEERRKLYSRVKEYLDPDEKLFWDQYPAVIENGPVHAARFEKYQAKFSGLAMMIIGKKALKQLFALNSMEDQADLFKRKIDSSRIKLIFKIVFHPRLYTNKGIATEGLKYSEHRKASDFFYSRFRDFCCSTPARQNYHLQFTFNKRILYPEAWPEYLSEDGMNRIRKNHENLEIHTISIQDVLANSNTGDYNKFHLSNIGDWLSTEEYEEILRLIMERSSGNTRISSRYIYYKHPIPEDLRQIMKEEDDLASKLAGQDRYPFYQLRPLLINNETNKLTYA